MIDALRPGLANALRGIASDRFGEEVWAPDELEVIVEACLLIGQAIAKAGTRRSARLEAALRPFAVAHGGVASRDREDPRWPDRTTLACDDAVGFAEAVTVGDLRRAAKCMGAMK